MKQPVPGRRIRARTLAKTACAGALVALALPSAVHAELPNGRVYEMVTPVEKGGYDITAWTGGGYAVGASDGERVNYGLYGGIEGGTSAALGTALLQAKRTPAGWTSAGLAPALQPGVPYKPSDGQGRALGETPDLTTMVISSTQPATPGAASGLWNLFARAGDGAFSLLAPGLLPYSGLGGSIAVPGMTDDGRHVLFEAGVQLTPDAAPGVTNLYESVDGVVRLAGILPDGSTPPTGSTGPGRRYHRILSADGSHVFFLSGGELYVRIDGQQTVRVSRPYDNGGGVAGTAGTASSVWATPDGSKVVFLSTGRLTPDATVAGDVYLFDVATQRLTNLTATSGRTSPTAISGIAGISDDGGTVYFSSLRLPNLPVLAGVRAMYAWRQGQLRLVAELRNNQSEAAATIASYVAPGGRLVFNSPAAFPGYPTTVGAARLRIFLYDPAGAGRIVTCLSCLADGTADLVDNMVGNLADSQGKLYSYRRANVISDDGRRIWFETASALLPEDQNGRLDVYQWEEGAGLSLISTGRATSDSYFGDASPDGRDVFFYTRDRLAPEDTDGLLDLYDARVGGGLPSRVARERDRSCPAAGCQGDPTGRPQDRDAGSVTDPSDGDVTDPIAPADPVPFALTLLKASATRTTVIAGVHVNRAQKVSVRLQMRSGGRWVAAGAKVQTLRRAGSTSLRVSLSKKARKQLTRTRRLTVRVEARAGGQVRRKQLTVKAPRRAKGKANG